MRKIGAWFALFAPLVVSGLLLTASCQVVRADSPGESRLRIAVFTPTSAGNTYWPEVHAVLRSAASDLGLDLEIHEFDVADRFAKVSEGVRRLTTGPLPDAAVLSVEFGEAVRLMNAAEESGIPFFLNGPLFPEELMALGEEPGREYQCWVGYFLEDEELKGYMLAQRLIAAAKAARKPGDTGTIYVAGINGSRAWYGSILREGGLRRAIDEDPDAELLQMVYTRWTHEEGRTMAQQVLRRYPAVSVLWAASDQLALGAAEAISSTPTADDMPVFTGGLDLSEVGLKAVLRGELLATVASTPLLWAQVIIELHDHLHGLDDTAPKDSVLIPAPLLADQSTAEAVRDRMHKLQKLDFREFSRFHHGARARCLGDVMGEY